MSKPPFVTLALALMVSALASATDLLTLPPLNVSKLAQQDQASDSLVGPYRYGVVTALSPGQRLDSQKGSWLPLAEVFCMKPIRQTVTRFSNWNSSLSSKTGAKKNLDFS